MPNLSDFDRLIARRFSGGLTPDLATDINRTGGGRAWFGQQLRPALITDPDGDMVDGWFPSLGRTPEQIFDRQVNEVQGAWEVMWDLSRWSVARRIHSRRALLEVMVDFWANLLNVPITDDDACFYRVSYDQAIRRYALTNFEALLKHTVLHSAMGLYLDNAVSTKDAPNENLGRELLELHTVGVDAGYSEDDVKQSSKLLTGYRVDVWWPSFRSFYDPSVHARGPISVMGFRHDNADRDGRKATMAYLRYLARHPATAQRLARRLCVRFVSDDPSPALVTAVANAYRANKTAIKPTLKALVDHPDFAQSAGQRIRTPTEDYVATVRALQIRLQKPVEDNDFANAMYWQYHEYGNAPFEWPTPDGYPELGAGWTTAGRVLNSLSSHVDLAAGWWPKQGAAFRPFQDWLPALPATLDAVIDGIGRQLLGEPVPAATRQGVATVLGLSLDQQMTRVGDWRVLTILATLLDTPTHMHR